MELLKKKNSKFYWYDFTVRGERYRGSTKETNITRAGKIAALKLTQAIEAMARQPEATGRISLYMWIGFSLTEALALIGLVAPFIFKY